MLRPTFVCICLVLLAACEPTQKPVSGPAPVTPALPLTGCGAPSIPISEVQGRGASSPLLGQAVSVEAVVTTVLVDGVGGVFLQEGRDDRDGDPMTSEALFIPHDSSQTTKPGDVLRVSGLVAELGDAKGALTSLSELTEFRVCGKAPLPSETSVEQAPLVAADWEQYEAMRLALDTPVTVIANYNLLKHGELLVSLSGRQYAPTQIYPPGEDARKRAEDNQRNRLILDDGSFSTDPKRVSWLPQALTNEAPYRVGTRLGEVHGVLDHRNEAYRLHVSIAPVAEQAPRAKVPPAVPGRLQVAAFNMLNWFNGDGKGGGFPTERGATTAEEAGRQRAKLVASIQALKPDIAALMEVENDLPGKLSALDELVRELNRSSGLGYTSVAIPGEKLGGDAIRVAFIYRASRVKLRGKAAALELPPFDNFNRVPLAQTFEEVKGGGALTVVANHFKSKGGCDPANSANVDRGDGQGCWNAMRVEAARALADWLKSDPTSSGDPDILIIGDLNAYGQEDPLRYLGEQGYLQLGEGDAESPHYSFVYDGLSGSLDHALASDSLKSQVAGAETWHINADEFPGFDYNKDPEISAAQQSLYRKHPYRSSDHDPLLIGLDLTK